ncbi:uncharacterized protein LOC117496349 [Trematomus bernacchii]|uniref:uncharacterized protein LOC117496349 n=1 Tax=Trematomus bernacchii TaxID=40690 RepID=UPI00146C4176|nr:uncharacterized protein LOC117496349 [Trematomus bernacchii]
MEHWLWIILAALSFECKGQDTVTQPAGDVSATEGDTVTLDCTFQTSKTAYLFWYKQEVNGYPKYMLKRFSGGRDNAEEFKEDRFEATLNKTSVPLQISSAAVTDSAVYYCALRPTVTGNTTTLYKNLWSKDNTILHNIHQRFSLKNSNSILQNSLLLTLYKNLWSKDNQLGDNSPTFILSRFKIGTGKTEDEDRFSSTLNSSLRSVPLKIQKLQLSDSAVYYCAVRPTVTGNTNTLYKNLWSKDNTILHSIHQRESLSGSAVKISLHYRKKSSVQKAALLLCPTDTPKKQLVQEEVVILVPQGQLVHFLPVVSLIVVADETNYS